MKPISAFAFVAALAAAQPVDLAPVISRVLSRSIDLPGEFQPFLSVVVRARVPGYVDRILVDRGSAVREGERIAELSAPEMTAKIAEAESKVQAAEADRLQAEAQLAGLVSTYERLKKASDTPGAIAGNELDQAAKQVDAAKALIRSREQSSQAAASNVQSLKDVQAYLHITAPFEGVVTERLAHPGALVGPGSDSGLVVLQQVSRLRLVVAVPEEDSGSIPEGARVEFRVPAFPERTFSGTVARSSHTLDPKTRTMAVELDVANRGGALAPGMYPTVKWPVRRSRAALLVPRSSVVTTTERTFVIRPREGRAEWIDVKKGAAVDDLVEVLGELHTGDKVVKRATDEIRDGSQIR